MKLSRDLHITQKSAWYTLHRLRQTFITNEPPPEFEWGGEFQIDHAYIGGLEKNKHEIDQIPGGQGGATKMIVISIIQTNSGKMWVDVLPDTRSNTISNIISHRSEAERIWA